MKKLVPLFLLGALSLALPGCGKKQEPPPPPPPKADSLIDSAKKAGENVADAAKDAGKVVADKAKDVGQAVGDAAKSAYSDAKQSVGSTYTTAVGRAESLFKESKFEDALKSLKSIGDMKLTPEQKKTVDDLKGKIQKAIDATKSATTNAVNKAGELFK